MGNEHGFPGKIQPPLNDLAELWRRREHCIRDSGHGGNESRQARLWIDQRLKVIADPAPTNTIGAKFDDSRRFRSGDDRFDVEHDKIDFR